MEAAKATTLKFRHNFGDGSLKREATEEVIGGFKKRSKNGHPHHPDEVILGTEDHPHLPNEIIFDNIMTRVPFSTLMSCSSVCKNWYKSILHDPYFAIAYLSHNPKKEDLPFVFYHLNIPNDSSSKFPNLNYIFGLEIDDGFKRRHPHVDSYDHLSFDEKFVFESEINRIELVGNCNGLVCFSRSSSNDDGIIRIINPRRDEVLNIFNPPIIKGGGGCIVCCYGFGFDSFTHEYKVVLIVRTTATTAVRKSGFKCLVFTLGTNSWRETSTTIPLSPPRTTSFYKSAIFCGGALFWRTKSSSSSSSDNNMLLLSFDLHDEEFQVIQLPAECASSSLLEQKYQIIDPLLEFKGSPCVARLEKTILGGGGGWSCTSTSTNDQNTSYCYKVHLHILKEYSKVGLPNEQVWIKETFDVAPNPATIYLSPAVPCFMILYGDRYTYRPPPTRIVTSSDGRVFLYCVDSGKTLQICDLQTKRCRIGITYNYTRIFSKKRHSEVYDQIDYHLNGGHIENFMSMLAFIPNGGGGGAPPRLDRDELMRILDDKQRPLPVVGYLSIQHKKPADIYLL